MSITSGAPKRIVSTQGEDGKSHFSRVDEAALLPISDGGRQVWRIWGSDSLPIRLPADGRYPQGCEPSEAGLAEFLGRMPKDSSGVRCTLIRFQPGYKDQLYAIDSADIVVVLDGEVTCVLDSGEEMTVRHGDFVVQNGVKKAWENRSDRTAMIVGFVLSGTRASGMGPGE